VQLSQYEHPILVWKYFGSISGIDLKSIGGFIKLILSGWDCGSLGDETIDLNTYGEFELFFKEMKTAMRSV
jgi:hypothetical protein